MLKISENNGTEEFGLVTPTPEPMTKFYHTKEWCKLSSGCFNIKMLFAYTGIPVIKIKGLF